MDNQVKKSIKKKTQELLNKRNKYRSGLGFEQQKGGTELKRKVINDVVIKKKIVEELRRKKQNQKDEKSQIQDNFEEIVGLNKFFDEGENLSKFNSKSNRRGISDPRDLLPKKIN